MGYEYYEFQRIDGALTDEQRRRLDEISSRSTASRHGISFEYNYSELRCGVRELVGEYFDAGLHISKYGRRRLLFRFPEAGGLGGILHHFALEGALEVESVGEHIVLDADIAHPELGGWISSGEGWLDQLVEVRDELKNGDLRGVYLMWLAGLDSRQARLDPDAAEPPVPAGLEAMSRAQQRLCDFFMIDEDFLVPAQKISPPDTPEGGPDWEAAIDELSTVEMRDFLLQLARGRTDTGAQLRSLLRERLDYDPLECRARRTDRTIRDYRNTAERIAEQRAIRRAEERRREHEREMKRIWSQRDTIWEEVIELIDTRDTSNYDVAVDKLADLHDAAEHHDQTESFAERIVELRDRYNRLYGLKRRMNNAGLPQPEDA